MEFKQNRNGQWLLIITENDSQSFFKDKKYNAADLDTALSPLAHASARFADNGDISHLIIPVESDAIDTTAIEAAIIAYNPETSSDEDAQKENEDNQDSIFETRLARLFVRGLNQNAVFRRAVQRALGIPET